MTSQTLVPNSVTVLGSTTGDNSLRSFNFVGVDDVVQLELELDNISGAVASLEVEPIPVPAALPMLASAVGGLALLRRYRNRQAA